jgi:hypothetical protein
VLQSLIYILHEESSLENETHTAPSTNIERENERKNVDHIKQKKNGEKTEEHGVWCGATRDERRASGKKS